MPRYLMRLVLMLDTTKVVKFSWVAGRQLEAVPAQVLPGGLAGDGQRARPRRRDLHNVAVPDAGARAAVARQLQSARPQERGEFLGLSPSSYINSVISLRMSLLN